MENEIIELKEKEQEKNKWIKLAQTYLTNTNLKLTENELREFIMLCQMYKLNPLKREIYAIKYGTTFNVITNYYEYIKRADATGLVEYYNVEMISDENDNLIKAVFVGKRADRTRELKMEFYLREWNNNTAIWKTKPRFMLEKCALANGLRRLFPNELANMPYINEELWYQNKQNEAIIKENYVLEQQNKNVDENNNKELPKLNVEEIL